MGGPRKVVLTPRNSNSTATSSAAVSKNDSAIKAVPEPLRLVGNQT